MVDSFIFILKHTGETDTGKFCGFYLKRRKEKLCQNQDLNGKICLQQIWEKSHVYQIFLENGFCRIR